MLFAQSTRESQKFQLQNSNLSLLFIFGVHTQSTSIYISNANFKLVPLGHCITYIHHASTTHKTYSPFDIIVNNNTQWAVKNQQICGDKNYAFNISIFVTNTAISARKL